MARGTWTPFDKPKTLWERLLFPSLREAYEEGAEVGYLEGKQDGIDTAFISTSKLSEDPEWLQMRLDHVNGKRADS